MPASTLMATLPDRVVEWSYRALRPRPGTWEDGLATAREFRALGPTEVLVNGERASLGGHRRRALLTRLLLDANRVVPADRLIEDLWGERARPTTANALQVAVSALRNALDPERDGILTNTAGGYLLRVEAGELDLDRFADLSAEGRRQLEEGHAVAAVGAFDAALALQRGVPLADLAGEPCAQPEVERLVEACHAVAEDRIDALLAAGRHVEAVPELERLVRETPLRERRWSQLLLALYRAGRQSDALRAYASVRELLAEELGVDPSPALRDLEQAILEQRPELDLRAAVAAPRVRAAGGTTSVLVAEVIDATSLAERAGPDAWEQIRSAHDAEARRLAVEHGGEGFGSVESALLLRFDSAASAVACSVALQRSVATTDHVQLQVGLDAGEAIDIDDDVATSVDRALGLARAALPGEILASGVVRSLVEPRREHPFGVPKPLVLDGFAVMQEGHPVLWADRSGGRDGDRVGGPDAVARRSRRHPAPLVATDEYVGRDAELAVARAAWRRARGGGRVVLAVAGEPGAGKTRLCAELSKVVAAAGGPVAYGRCEPDGTGYQPVARAVAHLVDGFDDWQLHSTLGGLAGDLAAVVPEIAARLPGLNPPRNAEPQLQRLRVADAVARVIEAAPDEAPPLVVLDDLHWADGATAAVLRHLGTGDGPLLLVAAYRDTDVDPSSPVVGCLADLRRQGLVEDIRLGGLDPEEVGRCVQARAGRACTPSVAAIVHERTGGIPLLVEELTRALLAADALDADRERIEQLSVPVGVRDLVAQRLPALGDAATALLEAAAVVGSELDWEVLPALADRPETEVVEALDRAVAGGLLVEVRGTAGRYAFAHDLVRQALYDGLGTARRASLHRRAASALAAQHAGAAEVAHHLVRGATASTAADASMAAVVAAEDAVGRVAHEEAARWYGDALAVLGDLAADDQRATLLLGRGDALASAGQRDAAVETLRDAAAAARRAGNPPALARVALALSGPSMGLWVVYGSDDVELVAMLDEAAGSLGAEHDALRARVLACRASCRSVADPPAAAKDSALALALAESTGDPLALRTALFGTHMTSRRPGAARDRLALTDRLLGLADEADHPTDVLDALQLRLADLVELGELHQADLVVDRIEAIGEATRNVTAAWNVRRYRAMREALAGRFKAALELGEAALDIGKLVQPDNAFGSYGGLLSTCRVLQGEADGFADGVESLAARTPGMSLYRALVAFYAAYEGQPERARTSVRANLDAGIPIDNNWLTSHTALAVACHAVGDTDSAAVLYRALAPSAGLHAAIGSWVASLGPVDRVLALLAEVLDDDEAADRHADTAEAWCRQVGAWAYLAVVRFERARRLLRRGDAAAGPALDEARATAIEADVGLVVGEIERLDRRR